MKRIKYLIILFATISITMLQNIHCASIEINQEKHLEKVFLEAARWGYIEDVEACLSKNVNVNAIDEMHDTALMCAIDNGQIEMVRMLLEYQSGENFVNVNAVDDFGNTALTKAVERNSPEIVEMLLAYRQDQPENAVNINIVDECGWNALMYAARKGYCQVVQKLLEYKQNDPIRRLNVNATNNDGETALMLAATSGHVEVVRSLLRNAIIDVNNGKRKI